MRLQALFVALLYVLSIQTVWAGCFNFKSKISKPLRDPIALVRGKDTSKKGLGDDGLNWAQVRGVVHKPIEKVLKLLEDPNTEKSPRATFQLKVQDNPNDLASHLVTFTVKPFLFFKVSWSERWVYVLADGTAKAPQKIVISYEKVAGTHYINHLCGSIVLRKLNASSTDVYQYEEARASHRSVDDTLNGLLGTLKTLRK